MKLRFIGDAMYRGELKYKEGQEVEVSNDKGEADRWLKRNLAVDAKEIPKKEVKKEVKKEDKKEDKKEVKKEVKKDAKSKKEASLDLLGKKDESELEL